MPFGLDIFRKNCLIAQNGTPRSVLYYAYRVHMTLSKRSMSYIYIYLKPIYSLKLKLLFCMLTDGIHILTE